MEAFCYDECMSNKDRTLHIEGLVNARDLGGLDRRNGSLTPAKVFYRTESLEFIEGKGWDQMRDEGIRTIVDLRQQGERDKDINTRPEWLNTVHVDLDGLENSDFWNDYWDFGLASTALYYLPHLKAMPERAASALKAVVTAPEGGVLFHCKSGRDRTGLVSLLLLSAIDTDPDEIVDDYLETIRLGDIRGQRTNRPNPEPELEALCNERGTTTEGAFRAAVDGLDIGEFLNDAVLDKETQQALTTWRGAIK